MRAAGESPRARRSSLPRAAASSWARASALTPDESQNTVAVMSAVITSGDSPATAASRSRMPEALVMSISAGMVTTACRPDQRTPRSGAVPVPVLGVLGVCGVVVGWLAAGVLLLLLEPPQAASIMPSGGAVK